MLQVEEGVLEELLKAESLLGVRLEAADEEVSARLGELPAAGDDDGLPLLDLDQNLGQCQVIIRYFDARFSNLNLNRTSSMVSDL